MFHRLVTPTYIGGLPAGYDMLNAGGALIDAILALGPTAPTYFVGFGEDADSKAVNRGLGALAVNTDAIDDFLHGDFAVLASVDRAASAAAVIVGTATLPVFVGPPGTANTQAGLEPYFHITDQNNNDIVDTASNVQTVVTAASGGVGTFFNGTLTLTLNITPSVPYRIWYGLRSSLLEMKRDNFVRSSVWSAQHTPASLTQYINNITSAAVGKGAELVGLNDTGFTTKTLSIVTGGGIGTTAATVKQALQQINDRLVQRRGFAAVLTDGTLSVGGDFNGPNIDAALTALTEGTLFFRRGDFLIADGTSAALTGSLHLISDSVSGINLDTGRTFDLTLPVQTTVERIFLGSIATSLARFAFIPVGVGAYFLVKQSILQGGALYAFGGAGGTMLLEDVITVGATGNTNAGLDLAGEMFLTIRRCNIDAPDGSPLRNCYLHDFSDPGLSCITVEDSTFTSSTVGVHALEMLNVTVPTTFRNCTFDLTATSGSGYALFISACASIEFDNCTFLTSNGQAIWADNSQVTFKNCRATADNTTPGAALGQMVMISGSTQGTSDLRGLIINIGASAIKGVSATIQRAIVELGGKNNSASTDCRMLVDGLTVSYLSGAGSAHNFTTVLLHGARSSGAIGRYRNEYRNLVFDEGHVTVNNAGTLGGVYRPSTQYPAFVEIGGAESRVQCLVENLSIVDVVNPSTTHNRQVLLARRATLRGVYVDGSATAGAGAYARDLVEFYECTVYDLVVERNEPLACTGFSHVSLNVTTRIDGFEFVANTATFPTSAWVVYVSDHCEITRMNGFWSSAVAACTVPLVSCSHQACSFVNNTLFVDGSYAARMLLFNAGSDLGKVLGNRFYWKTGVAEILASGGAGTQVIDNILCSTVGIPTFSITGGSSIDDNNQAFTLTPAVPNPF